VLQVRDVSLAPYFSLETVNSDRYINDILNPFVNQLTAEESMGIFSKTTPQHMRLMQP
jgi:hypothetical protein